MLDLINKDILIHGIYSDLINKGMNKIFHEKRYTPVPNCMLLFKVCM